jgi:hypothetical protein
MKNSSLITILTAGVCVLGVVVLCLGFIFNKHYRTMRGLQQLIANAQNSRNVVDALANDAVEYSKKNPAIDPILRAVGAKPPVKVEPASTNRDAAK